MNTITHTDFIHDTPSNMTNVEYAVKRINQLITCNNRQFELLQERDKEILLLKAKMAKYPFMSPTVEERIVVRIGISKKDKPKCHVMPDWFSNVFDISYRRGKTISEALMNSENECTNSVYLELVLNHAQLARYTAFRRTDSLHEYYKYPHIISYEECPIVADVAQPIELRPGKRITP